MNGAVRQRYIERIAYIREQKAIDADNATRGYPAVLTQWDHDCLAVADHVMACESLLQEIAEQDISPVSSPETYRRTAVIIHGETTWRDWLSRIAALLVTARAS